MSAANSYGGAKELIEMIEAHGLYEPVATAAAQGRIHELKFALLAALRSSLRPEVRLQDFSFICQCGERVVKLEDVTPATNSPEGGK